MPVLDPEALLADRVRAIREYHQAAGIDRAELDISGGIDSGVMIQLVSRALGADKVTAVYSGIHSTGASRDRAALAAKAAGVPLVTLELGALFDGIVAEMKRGLAEAGYDMEVIERRCKEQPLVLGSFRSCIRAPIGRGLNRMTAGGIRHGTGNECEDRWLRFYQKGGDGEVDTNPIAMLAKGEVYQLARVAGVPIELIDALPSPDLFGVGDAHNDEDELRELTGVAWSYSRIDGATGEYRVVGTIERMSRFLDRDEAAPLFADAAPDEAAIAAMATAARAQFPGLADDEIAAFLRSARRMERVTRHKWNPNCPTLGERAPLVAAGILSNTLPEL